MERERNESGEKSCPLSSIFSPRRKQPLAGQADFWTNNPPAKLFVFPLPSSAARKRK